MFGFGIIRVYFFCLFVVGLYVGCRFAGTCGFCVLCGVK